MNMKNNRDDEIEMNTAKGYDMPRASSRRQYAVYRMSLKTGHVKLVEL